MKKNYKTLAITLILILLIQLCPIPIVMATSTSYWNINDIPYSNKFIDLHQMGNGYIALDKDGDLWQWTNNLPQKLSINAKFKQISSDGKGCWVALDINGNVWGWGYQGYGQLGTGLDLRTAQNINDFKVSTPTQITSGTKFTKVIGSIYNTLALDENGNIWGWGQNTSGTLMSEGKGDYLHYDNYYISRPKQLTTDGKYKDIEIYASVAGAIDKNNNLYMWGGNSHCELAASSDTYTFKLLDASESSTGNRIITKGSYTPIQVKSGTKFSKFSIGNAHVEAIDINGLRWKWGLVTEMGMSESSASKLPGYDSTVSSLYEPYNNSTVKYVDVYCAGALVTYLKAADNQSSISNKIWVTGNDKDYFGNTEDEYGNKFGGWIDQLDGFTIIGPGLALDENGYMWRWGFDYIDTNGNKVKAQEPIQITGERYTVTFKDGTTILKTQTVLAGQSATAPEVPTKEGHTFIGWDKSFDNITSNLTVNALWARNTFVVTFKNGDKVEKTESIQWGGNATAPELTKAGYTLSWDTDFSNITSDLEVNAVWTANVNTPYKVEHYVRNLDTEVEGYTLKETEDKEGTTDTTVTAEYKEYEGFTKNETYAGKVESGNVAGDGSLVLKLYYNRNVYNINYELNGGQATGSLTNKYTYGKEMILPNRVEKQGYTFAGWYDNENLTGSPITTIPSAEIGDKTFYAKWDAKGDIAYKIQHYKQKQDLSGYELAEEETKTGVTGAVVNAIPKTYSGYTENTEHSERKAQGTILADGSLTLKLYYDRNEFTVTFKDGQTIQKTEQVEKGQGATAPELTKAGYSLSWDTDFSNITSDLEVNAVWTANVNTPYKVEHYVRNLDTEVEGYTLKETEDKTGTTDTLVTAEYKEYEGFTKNEEYVGRVESGNVSGDGTLVLKLYYSRNSYNITYELNGGTVTGNLTNSYIYGKEMILPNRVKKEGYTFAGWYTNNEFTGSPVTSISGTETGNKTFYAKWVEADKDYYILSETYNIDITEKTITKVKPETTVETFLDNIETNGDYKVLNAQRQEVIGTSLVGTGYILQVTYKGKTYEYEIAVRGDIDGNGTITVTDLSMMNQALTKKIILTGIKQKAADIDYTGEITVTDLSMINQALTGKIIL